VSFVELCRQFIAIDTSPQAGTREGGIWLRNLALSYGLDVDLQEESFAGEHQANIFIRSGPAKTEEFLLQSHYDTANPGSPSLWTENMMNPFNGIIKEGKLFGLGACEGKIDLLCKLEALRSFRSDRQWKVSPVVAGTFGEQIGMQGMLRAIRKNKFNAKFGLVGEPSGQKLIFAGKGYATLEFHIPFSNEEREYRIDHNLKESVSTQSKFFKGLATHSSTGHYVENAINKAFEYLLQLPESVVLMEIEGGTNHNTVANNVVLELDLYGGIQDPMVKKLRKFYMLLQQIGSEFLVIHDAEFSPGHPTMNLGLIKSHEDHIHLTVACRFPPLVREEQIQGWLEKIQKGTTLVGGQCRVSDYKRPYRTDLNSHFVNVCKEALLSIDMADTIITLPSCTEMSILERKGVVCLGFGAGLRTDHASFSNQYVQLDELEKSIRFYRTIIERICL
jgi:succinyl-diaminopimelate desuccinylase